MHIIMKKGYFYMNGECNGIVHKIEAGDTLYKLSRRYGVKLIDIMRENPYLNVYNLRIGDEICIPTVDDTMRDYYMVKGNQTIGDVAKDMNTSISRMFEYNRELMDIRVPLGMVLRIPPEE